MVVQNVMVLELAQSVDQILLVPNVINAKLDTMEEIVIVIYYKYCIIKLLLNIIINEIISQIIHQFTECECDVEGSENQNCDSKTGKCTCKYGVVGDKCTKCSPDHFGFPNCKGTYNFIFVGNHFYF